MFKLDSIHNLSIFIAAILGGGMLLLLGGTDCSQATHKQECQSFTNSISQAGFISIIIGFCGTIIILIWKTPTDKPKGNTNDFRSPI